MKLSRICAIVALGVTVATGAVAQQISDARRFDGAWTVTLQCPATAAGVAGYTFTFPATVQGGHLHGQYGTPGNAPSLTYDGSIDADGTAAISANGITGPSTFNVGQVPKGVPYGYHFTARFDAMRGHGTKTEIRPCTMDFGRG
jgi:hypothetical protein